MVCIYDLLNLYLVGLDVLDDLIFGQGLLITIAQPLGKSCPAILTGLDTTILLNHPKPLLWRGLILLDLTYSTQGIADKDRLFGNPHITDVGILSEERADILGGTLNLTRIKSNILGVQGRTCQTTIILGILDDDAVITLGLQLLTEPLDNLAGIVNGQSKTTDTSVAWTHTGKLIDIHLILLIGVSEGKTMVLVFKSQLLLGKLIETLSVGNSLTAKLTTGGVVLLDAVCLLLGLDSWRMFVWSPDETILTGYMERLHILIGISAISILLVNLAHLVSECLQLCIDIFCLLSLLGSEGTVNLGILHIQINWYDATAKTSIIPYLIDPVFGEILAGSEPETYLGKVVRLTALFKIKGTEGIFYTGSVIQNHGTPILTHDLTGMCRILLPVAKPPLKGLRLLNSLTLLIGKLLTHVKDILGRKAILDKKDALTALEAQHKVSTIFLSKTLKSYGIITIVTKLQIAHVTPKR